MALVAVGTTSNRGSYIGGRIGQRILLTVVRHGRVARRASPSKGEARGVMITVIIGIVAARCQAITDRRRWRRFYVTVKTAVVSPGI